MVRELDKEKIKAVLEIIRKKPRTWSEIKEEYKNKNKNLEIPDKSLARILNDYLGYWGLVRKGNDGRWWYVAHEVAVEDKNYYIVMWHSLLVLPGLVEISREYGGFLAIDEREEEYKKLLLRIEQFVPFCDQFHTPYFHTPYSKKTVTEFAKEHLKTGYPEAYEAVSEALRNFKKQGENTEKRVTEEELKNFIERQPREIPIKSLESINLDNVEKYLKEDIERLNKIRQNANNKLFEIVSDVINGKPLKGECSGCPRVCLYYQAEEETR